MDANDYVPYGEEWKNELMKLPKIQIIAFLRAARLEINEAEAKGEAEARNKAAIQYFASLMYTHPQFQSMIIEGVRIASGK